MTEKRPAERLKDAMNKHLDGKQELYQAIWDLMREFDEIVTELRDRVKKIEDDHLPTVMKPSEAPPMERVV